MSARQEGAASTATSRAAHLDESGRRALSVCGNSCFDDELAAEDWLAARDDAEDAELHARYGNEARLAQQVAHCENEVLRHLASGEAWLPAG